MVHVAGTLRRHQNWGIAYRSLAIASVEFLPCQLLHAPGAVDHDRSPAKAQADGLLPRIAAFVGTYLPWTITFFGKTDQALPNLLSTACVLIGMIMMLVTIRHLGRSFSLVPQARSVVQTGPYRWIKHPLYLAEEIAILGVVLQYLTPVTVIVLVLHIGVQVCRILYEEDLLRRNCPEYSSYEASRWRLIPYVW